MSKIKLSIIIPIYNSKKYLAKCLDSVCPQYEKGIEIILIDDHSSDSSRKIIKKYKKKFNFLKVIYLQKNNGVSYSRNVGIKCSKGEYLYFVDSDDELVKKSLNNALYELYKFPETELFILNYIKKISKEKQILYNQVKDIRFKKIKPSNRKIPLIYYYKNLPFLTSWQFIFKKSFLKSNNLGFKNIYTSEDWDFIPKVLCLTRNFKFIKKPIYIWKISNTDSLGKKTGYLTAISYVKIISQLGQFIIEKKMTLKKREINLLIKVLYKAYTRFLLNILRLDSRSTFRMSKYLLKFRNTFKKLIFLKIINLNYLVGRKIVIKQKLTKHINKKDIIIKNLIKKFGKKDIIIFCAGAYTDIILQMFFNNGISIRFIIDNNVNYSRQKLNNISVFKPTYLKKNIKKFSNYKILICNKNLHAIKKINKQLLNTGFANKNITSLSSI